MQYDELTRNTMWRSIAIFKVVFRLYITVIIILWSDKRVILSEEAQSHAVTGHRAIIAHLENSRWRTAAILNMFSPYLSCQSSDFDEIWYVGANF